MKLEVGMYCRYKDFRGKVKINKIKKIQEADEVVKYDYISFGNDGILKLDIIKASFNIIDLIEVGDILVDDTNRKLEVYYDEELDYLYIEHIDGDNNLYCESIRKQSFINNIKAIVTKEQMEQMSYKIKE